MAFFRIACGFALVALGGTVHAQHFPPLDRDNPPKSRTVQNEGYCMMAGQDISIKSTDPLFSFDFASPGASGVIIIDGNAVQVFKEEQHVRVHAEVSAGKHMFNLKLIKPTALTFMTSNSHFKYCQ
jgi:hypothetical protein